MTLRPHLISVFIVLAGLSAQAEVHVEYKISRIQALLEFTLAIVGEPHHAPGLSEIFEKSTYNTPEIRKSLDKIKGLQKSYTSSFESSNAAKFRSEGQSVQNLLIIQSIYSKDIHDLSIRSLGLLPMADHLVFFQELKKIEPIFNKLIWAKLGPKLAKHKVLLETISKKAGLNEMFSKAEKFYKAQWPSESPFVIALYPVPYIKNFKNGTTSQSLGSVEIHGVLVETENKSSQLPGSFGVIFHELCHSIYKAQSDAFKLELEKYFLENPSQFAPQAYTWFNEAAATAIGNGWAYARASGGTNDKASWYNNPTINGYAQEIYPIVQEALEKGQSLDRPMVTKFVNAFEKRFPKAIYAYESLFNRLIVAHDGEIIRSQDIRLPLRKNLQIQSLSIGSPIDDPNTLHDISADEGDSLLFIFSDKTQIQLKKIAEAVPYIKEHLKDLEKLKNRDVYSGLGKHGGAFVFVKIQSQKDFDEAIAAIIKKEYIDPEIKIWSY